MIRPRDAAGLVFSLLLVAGCAGVPGPTPVPTGPRSTSTEPPATAGSTPATAGLPTDATATPPAGALPFIPGGAAVLPDWPAPQRIVAEDYESAALVVDDDGQAHIAAARAGGIWYIAQRADGWTRQRLTPDEQTYRAPQIARDTDGSLWIAFAAFSDDEFGFIPAGLFYVTNATGAWSAPVELPARDAAATSFAVRDGVVHLAYVSGFHVDIVPDDPSRPIRYLIYAGGRASDVEVVANGSAPVLRLDSAGHPVIAFAADERLYLAAPQPGGTFAVEPVPGAGGWSPRLAIDLAGTVHIAWTGWTVGNCCPDHLQPVYHVRGDSAGWSAPELVADDGGWSLALEIDAHGGVHLVAGGSVLGTWYVTRRTNGWAVARLSDGVQSHVALAIDGAGRPHVTYVRLDSSGIWYAGGPE